jgi:hypothetical protein
VKTTDQLRTGTEKIKPVKLDTQVEGELSSIYNKKPKIYSAEDTLLRTNDGDVEIKVKIINTELTDVESKLFEERYFIPIERAESPRKVCPK